MIIGTGMFNESRAFEARFVMLAAEERYRDVPQPLLAERGNASYASKLCQVLLGFCRSAPCHVLFLDHASRSTSSIICEDRVRHELLRVRQTAKLVCVSVTTRQVPPIDIRSRKNDANTHG